MACRSGMLVVVLLASLLTSPPALAEEKSASVLDQLPRDTLIAARISRLDRLDAMVQPLAESFGLVVPPFGSLAIALDGVDLAGDAVVGIVGLGERSYAPFVLLPMKDYRAFVRSGDGDAGTAFTPITLAGEELVAQERGRWALIFNPTDDKASFQVGAANEFEAMFAAQDEMPLALLVTPQGLAELKRLATSRNESPYRLANRRRMLATRPINWKNPQDWEERLTLYSPLVARSCNQMKYAAFAVDVAEDQSLTVQSRFVADEASSASTNEATLPPVELAGQEEMLWLEGTMGSKWTNLLIDLYIDSFAAGSDEVDVVYFSPPELEKWREGVARARDLVLAARAVVIAPASGKPTGSNSAMVVEVKSAADFVSAFDASMADWNTLVNTATRRNADFVYETKPLTVGTLEGKRYTIDLPTAFRQDNIPEVREVMNKLYGRNGVRALDVLALDGKHVLLSDLPDDLRDQLIASLAGAEGQPLAARSGWKIEIEPATLQDWLNDLKRLTYGEDVVGWKPKTLDAQGRVIMDIITEEPALTVRCHIPGEVVRALGQLSRAK